MCTPLLTSPGNYCADHYRAWSSQVDASCQPDVLVAVHPLSALFILNISAAAVIVVVVVISIPSIPLSAPLVSEVSSSLSVSHSELNQSRKLVGGWHGCSYNLMRSGGPSYLAMSRSLPNPLALPRDHPLQSLQGFSSSLDNGYCYNG